MLSVFSLCFLSGEVMQFQAEFDRAGLSLSIASILILLYFGLSNPSFVTDYWVAFAFWTIGFMFSILFFTRRTIVLSFGKLFRIGFFTGLTLISFAGLNYAYNIVAQQQIMITSALSSFATGISEELFFGVFLIGFLINWLQFNPALAIIISSGSHALYHVPQWGENPSLLMLFFMCFVIARSLYVFVFPKVGMILGAHGIWNLGMGLG